MSGRKGKGKAWDTGRGALLVIAAMLIASAAVRLASGTGQAIAQELLAAGSASTPEAKPQQCEDIPRLEEVLASLSGRKEQLEERERRLAEREKALSLAQEELRRNLNRLEEAESRLEATIARSLSAAEDDLARLTAVYENMKPKEAAVLFEEMAPEFAAGFIGRMRPDAAAQVMAGLSPQSAYSISVILAGRNTRQPEN